MRYPTRFCADLTDMAAQCSAWIRCGIPIRPRPAHTITARNQMPPHAPSIPRKLAISVHSSHSSCHISRFRVESKLVAHRAAISEKSVQLVSRVEGTHTDEPESILPNGASSAVLPDRARPKGTARIERLRQAIRAGQARNGRTSSRGSAPARSNESARTGLRERAAPSKPSSHAGAEGSAALSRFSPSQRAPHERARRQVPKQPPKPIGVPKGRGTLHTTRKRKRLRRQNDRRSLRATKPYASARYASSASSGTSSRATMLNTLIMEFRAGPAVSL